MSPAHILTIGLVAAAACAVLAGCGKQGVLEQPPPLFGSRAKTEYEARRAQEAADDAQRAAQRGQAQEPARDNTPRSVRDVRDPGQVLAPASQAPIPGAPNPMGAPVSPTGR